MNREERLQSKSARAIERAIQRAASYLENRDFSFRKFSNLIKGGDPAGEQPSEVPSIDDLSAYLESSRFLDDRIIWYELNQNGLSEIDLVFEDIGGGNLLASLSLFGRIQEKYLVTLTAEPKSNRKAKSRDYEVFGITFNSIDDNDSNYAYGAGSVNLSSGLMSIAEQSLGLGVARDDVSALTSVNSWILTAEPIA